ncbi:MAG: hypothetical protein WD066_15820 [Planctomycetaceae bacterium]
MKVRSLFRPTRSGYNGWNAATPRGPDEPLAFPQRTSNFVNTVLFLCTGNYYRSRFAEVLFNHLAELERLPWRAVSRGLRPDPEQNVGPLSFHVRTRLERLGISIGDDVPFPIQVVEDDFRRADHVVAVKAAEHRRMIADRYPDWESRVEFWNVHDIDCAEPATALPMLEAQVRRLFLRLRSLVPAVEHASRTGAVLETDVGVR